MKIDCTACEMYRSEHCDDCLVTALLHPPDGVVEIYLPLSRLLSLYVKSAGELHRAERLAEPRIGDEPCRHVVEHYPQAAVDAAVGA